MPQLAQLKEEPATSVVDLTTSVTYACQHIEAEATEETLVEEVEVEVTKQPVTRTSEANQRTEAEDFAENKTAVEANTIIKK